MLFLEEMASILLTPFMLWFALPKCAPAVVQFVRDFTVHVEGVGDVCSLAAFQLQRHGNAKYGSPFQAPKVLASHHLYMTKVLQVLELGDLSSGCFPSKHINHKAERAKTECTQVCCASTTCGIFQAHNASVWSLGCHDSRV